MKQQLSALEIVRLAGLREVDPQNPLARQLVSDQLKSNEAPDPTFGAKLQVAWRDGRLDPQEIEFCQQLGIEHMVYLRMRKAAEPCHKGQTKFERVKELVLEL